MRTLFALLALTTLLSACQSAPAPMLPPAAAPVQARSAAPGPIDAQFFNTARDAFRWAEIEARRWDFGARLAKVEGRNVDERGRSMEWQFYFTAIGKDKALMVTSRNSKREVPNTFFGGGLMDLSWRVDSDKALEKAAEQGLKSFPVISMELDSFLSWDIRSFDGFYRVDARS